MPCRRPRERVVNIVLAPVRDLPHLPYLPQFADHRFVRTTRYGQRRFGVIRDH